MKAWQQLGRIGLLGTGTGGYTAPAMEGALAESAAGVEGATAEQQLLAHAALVGIYNAAATRVPTEVFAAATLPEPEVLTRTSAERLGLLDRVLNLTQPDQPDVLLWFLELLKRDGQMVSPGMVPRLLAFGARSRASRAGIAGAVGNMGRWLGTQNREWRWMAGGASGECFGEGPIEERAANFAEYRVRAPDAARAELQERMKELSPKEREAYLGVIAADPQPADEPFLEELLKERAQGVRDLAARGLASLPGSAYLQRMVTRARQHVRVTALGGGACKLEVELPEEPDKKAKGVEPVAMQYDCGGGPKASLLGNLVASASLEGWLEGGVSKEAFVAACNATTWDETLRRGLFAAAVRQRRADWLALVEGVHLHWLAQIPVATLERALSRDQIEAMYLVKAEGRKSFGEGVSHFIGQLPGPWGLSFSTEVWERIKAVYTKSNIDYWELQSLGLFARRAHVALLDQVAALERPESGNSYEEKPISHAVGVAHLRQAIAKEFAR